MKIKLELELDTENDQDSQVIEKFLNAIDRLKQEYYEEQEDDRQHR